MKILISGVAGFIGLHVADILLSRGYLVFGVDNLNDYYDVNLKKARLNQLLKYSNFKFFELDIADLASINELFSKVKPNRVVNLAAQAGVRYSIKNPQAYVQSNLVGFINILEGCRNYDVEHLVYASSSSVYGANTKLPFSVKDNVDYPVSLYAATKKSNELMAHSYSYLYGIPTTGLRFFTVYGPWGRPDMAPWLFTDSILNDRPIEVFNMGYMKRDFTFIDDIANGTVKVLDTIPSNTSLDGPSTNLGGRFVPYKLYNIGSHAPIDLMSFIETLELALRKKAIVNFKPMQNGDVVATYADIEDLKMDIGFEPKTELEEGLAKWVSWYKTYFRL